MDEIDLEMQRIEFGMIGEQIAEGNEDEGEERIKESPEREEDDLSIYSSNMRDIMLDDDELSPSEEAFITGYEDI